MARKNNGEKRKNEFNVIITGVGGQGVMTLGSLLSLGAIREEKYVMTSELHGLAKRFGHTEFHLRIGDVKTTVVPNMSADLIIALEPLESLQLIKYCSKERTIVYLDSIQIKPTQMDIENISYPTIEEIKGRLKPHVKEIYVYPASESAKKIAGNMIYSNVYLLGKIIGNGHIDIKKKTIVNILEEEYGKENENLKVFKEALKDKK
ncbi:MAG: 2-oxoacid:acceptor oxidoreductase family protein [Candidatus Micrarchaeota archaeon]|nr:2-oxoacid:acceptor oxidoreductase family protein [Candidatus Micrarchaeota archaeon]